MLRDQSNDSKLLRELKDIGDHFSCGLTICRTNREHGFEIRYLSTALAEIYETDADTLRHSLTDDNLFCVHVADRELVKMDIFGKQPVCVHLPNAAA